MCDSETTARHGLETVGLRPIGVQFALSKNVKPIGCFQDNILFARAARRLAACAPTVQVKNPHPQFPPPFGGGCTPPDPCNLTGRLIAVRIVSFIPKGVCETSPATLWRFAEVLAYERALWPSLRRCSTLVIVHVMS